VSGLFFAGGRPQMMSHLSRGLCVLLIADQTAGHGRITWPPSTRHGGSLETGNRCGRGAEGCNSWFSNNVKIPGTPSLASPDLRTVQPNVTGQPQDVYAASPWRAPGSAPVLEAPAAVSGEAANCPTAMAGTARVARRGWTGNTSRRWASPRSGSAAGRLKSHGQSPRTTEAATPGAW
jgi:hypothetical protein